MSAFALAQSLTHTIRQAFDVKVTSGGILTTPRLAPSKPRPATADAGGAGGGGVSQALAAASRGNGPRMVEQVRCVCCCWCAWPWTLCGCVRLCVCMCGRVWACRVLRVRACVPACLRACARVRCAQLKRRRYLRTMLPVAGLEARCDRSGRHEARQGTQLILSLVEVYCALAAVDVASPDAFALFTANSQEQPTTPAGRRRR